MDNEDKYTDLLNIMVLNDQLLNTLREQVKNGEDYSDTVDKLSTNWRIAQDILDEIKR
jgi:hypothetical protein